jgi:hypothetical protein
MAFTIHPGMTQLWQAATDILGPELNDADYQKLAFDPTLFTNSSNMSSEEDSSDVSSEQPGTPMQLDSSSEEDAYIDPVFLQRFGIETDVRFSRTITVDVNCEKKLAGCVREYERTLPSQPSAEQKRVARLFKDCIYGASRDGDDPWTRKYEIKWVNEQIGHGLFAKQKFKAGDVIGYYAGYLTDKPFNQAYSFGFDGSVFDGLNIDPTHFGNAMRFINHTSDKFANVKTVEYFQDGLPFVMFVAKKDMEPGDEMLYDYGVGYWDTQGIVPENLFTRKF